jgi:parallel beta-helix repeat protein
LTLDAAGSLQTTNNQTLTIGGDTTGDINISPRNGSGIVTVNGTLAAKTSGGATIVVAASDSSAKGKLQADYVADGTDDDVTIETAIAALPSTGGSVVLLDGTYSIGDSAGDGIDLIKSNVSIIGSGRSTVLQRQGDTASNDGVITVGDNSTTVTGVVISDLAIDGQKGTYAGAENLGIYYKRNVYQSKIINSWIHDNDGNGVYLYGLGGPDSYNVISNNDIRNNDDYGVRIENTDANTISHNVIQANLTDGIIIQGSYTTVTSNLIYSNSADGIQIASSGTKNTISGNTIRGNSGVGVYVFPGNDNTITGNTITENTDGVRIDTSSDNIVSSNVITDNTQYGIILTSGAETIVSGNTVRSSGSHGIYVYNSSDNSTITNNFIEEVGASSDGILVAVVDNLLVSGNRIQDSGGSRYGINISDVNADNNYIGQNEITGTGFAQLVVNAGTGTTQQTRNQFAIEGASLGKSLLTLNQTNTNWNILAASSSGITRMILDSTGRLGLGTITPQALLHVNGGDYGGNALAIFNQTGTSTNDILAASSSGVTKFVIKNDGTASSSAGFTIDGIGQIQSTLGQTLTIGGGSTGNLILGKTSQTITLPGFDCSGSGNGGKLTTTAGGVLTCASDGTGSASYSPFQESTSLGLNYQVNATEDFILGGTATTSAKFAFIGNALARGLQTASISGNIVLDSTGSIQTTNNQTLTLGGSTTGNIIIDSNSNLITANDAITLTNGTLNSSVASGGTAFTLDADNAFSTGNLFSLTENNGGTQHLTIDDAGNFNLNGTSATKDSGNTIYGSTAANGTLFLISTTNSTKGAVYFQSTSNYVDGSNNLQLAGDATFSGNNIGIGTTANSGSNLRFSGSSNIDVFSNVGTTLLTIENKGVGGPASTYIEGKLGVGTSTLTGIGNFVGGNTGGNAAFIINQTGASGNDIFAASTSGITKFVIKNDGTASSSAGFTIDGIGNIQSTNYQTLTLGGGSTGNLILGKSSQSITLPGFDCSGSGNGGKLTTTAGGVLTCASDTSGGAGGYSPFQESTSLGLNYQVNNTEDFLIGGVATTSAKFAILGVAGARGTQTASLSGNIVLDAAGSLQTTKNQTLTIGGNTTGDIQLLPSNGSGTVYIGSGNGGQTIRTGGNLSIVPSDNVGGFNYVDIGEQVGNSLNGATFWFKDVAVGEGLHLKTPSALTTGSWETDGGFVTAFNGDVGTILSVESQGSITQTAAYIGANIDLATQVTVPNSSSGNQTGISLTLEDGGTSATTKGLILADTGTTGIDYGIDFSGVGKFNIAGINLNSGGNGTAISATANAGGQAAFILNKTGSSGNIFTASASGVTKFNIGLDGTASSSAGFTIDGVGNIQSTRNQTLTLGGNTTGNIMLSPLNNQGGVAINKTLGPLASLDIKDLSSVASQGSEKISNSNDSTFASNTGNWTTSGTPDWAINVASSGQARKNAPGTGALTLSNSALDSAPVAGQTYRVIFDYTTTASSSGNLIPSFGGTNGVTVGTEASEFSTSQVQIITATNTNQLQFTPSIN